MVEVKNENGVTLNSDLVSKLSKSMENVARMRSMKSGSSISDGIEMKSEKIRALVKGVWAFCDYLFVPQRRTKEYYSL